MPSFFFCFSVFPSSLTPPLLRFFENFERVTSPDYLPTRRDVLYSRVKTTGISETVFEIGQTLYRVHDVGGARSERRKWHYCFENVSTIIYTVALSDYDGVLMEDESQVLCHQQTPTPPSLKSDTFSLPIEPDERSLRVISRPLQIQVVSEHPLHCCLHQAGPFHQEVGPLPHSKLLP